MVQALVATGAGSAAGYPAVPGAVERDEVEASGPVAAGDRGGGGRGRGRQRRGDEPAGQHDGERGTSYAAARGARRPDETRSDHGPIPLVHVFPRHCGAGTSKA